jgi:hypothetical protein
MSDPTPYEPPSVTEIDSQDGRPIKTAPLASTSN